MALGTVRGGRGYCIRNQKPYLIEALTFRMRGHEEASGTKYIPQKLFEIWELKDPIKNYERWLIETNVLNEMTVAAIRNEFKEKIEEELKIGFAGKFVEPDVEEELEDVYAKAQDTRHKIPVIDNATPIHHSP